MQKLFVLVFLLVPCVLCTDWYVSITGNDEKGDGSKTNPWKTLVFATSQAASNDSIMIEPGKYSGSENFPSTTLSLTYAAATGGVSIVGEGESSCFTATNLGDDLINLTIRSLTLSQCSTSFSLQGANLAVHNSIFEGNSKFIVQVLNNGSTLQPPLQISFNGGIVKTENSVFSLATPQSGFLFAITDLDVQSGDFDSAIYQIVNSTVQHANFRSQGGEIENSSFDFTSFTIELGEEDQQIITQSSFLTLHSLSITGGSLDLSNSTFTQGSSTALHVAGTQAMVSSCSFIQNGDGTANGGAIFASDNANLTSIQNLFSQNQAKRGGGIYCANSTATVEGCSFIQNRASYGGAAECDQCTTSQKDNTFIENSSSIHSSQCTLS